jgi:hypothetical protein
MPAVPARRIETGGLKHRHPYRLGEHRRAQAGAVQLQESQDQRLLRVELGDLRVDGEQELFQDGP